ncbi:MAG: hypothetical protein HQ562_05955 [Candidatus Marinimicrobia bacterium]|nr:hypothetical protein [Candidatus Neomarinimicrobiota bacterium]
MIRSLRGSVTPTAIIFTMVSMLLTVGFLRYSVSNKAMQDRRIAREKALLMAETGLNYLAMPALPKITQDTVIVSDFHDEVYPYLPEMEHEMGTFDSVGCGTYLDENLQTVYYGYARGIVTLPNPYGDPIKIRRTVVAEMAGEAFSDFMYFTETEEPGGGPYTGDGAIVTFGANDVLEGRVHTNGTMTISDYGCPQFTGDELSDVGAHQGIDLAGCDSNAIFSGEWDDSARYRQYPPTFSVDLVKNSANYIFTAEDLLGRRNKKDSLIMTEIEFHFNGFTASQWPYVIPPLGADGPEPITYTWDTDTTIFLIDNRKIGFDESFDNLWGYFRVDTIIATLEDSEGNPVRDELDQYDPGDTLFVSSTSPDSAKVWLGVIQTIQEQPSRFIFTVQFYSQQFPAGSHGFSAGEEVLFHYLAPSVGGVRQKFANYHNHPDDGSVCQSAGFHHFDFDPPPLSNLPAWVLPPTTFPVVGPKIIYIKGGQVQVKGIVDGQYTIVTDDPTWYRRHDRSDRWDRCYNNIWLTDDIVYQDSNPITGAVTPLSPNRLGLISGGNIIIANTAPNGWKNRQEGQDIKINAALMALEESFVCHYWQNTLTGFHAPNEPLPALSLADGRGPYKDIHGFPPIPTLTGASDLRGIVHLWGSIIQLRRGYMKRNSPGPYSAFPGVGYDKDYHFDYNLWIYPPPKFPITTDIDGGVILTMRSYNAIH